MRPFEEAPTFAKYREYRKNVSRRVRRGHKEKKKTNQYHTENTEITEKRILFQKNTLRPLWALANAVSGRDKKFPSR